MDKYKYVASDGSKWQSLECRNKRNKDLEIWWCCSADYPNHETTCKNYAKEEEMNIYRLYDPFKDTTFDSEFPDDRSAFCGHAYDSCDRHGFDDYELVRDRKLYHNHGFEMCFYLKDNKTGKRLECLTLDGVFRIVKLAKIDFTI